MLPTNLRYQVSKLYIKERILLSSKIIKVNQVNKKQERVLLITNKAVYNLLPQEENPVIAIFSIP